MNEVKMDSYEDLVNLVRCLPEEGRKDFLSVFINLQDGDITVAEAMEYIKVIFDNNQLIQ